MASAREKVRRKMIEMARRRVRPGSGSRPELLRARTWGNTVNVESLRGLRTPFVVVGAVATALYMPERSTRVLDVLVCQEDAPSFRAELEALGFVFEGNLTVGGTSWRSPEGEALDVLESSEPWAREAVERPNHAPDGTPIIPLEYLVILKLDAGSPQDVADLVRMLGAASEHSLDLVRRAVARYRPNASEDVESLVELGRLEYDEGRSNP